jgi:hypothetical protein
LQENFAKKSQEQKREKNERILRMKILPEIEKWGNVVNWLLGFVVT